MMVTLASLLFFFFFFQAEDGIRDLTVTGVQTCALPISNAPVWPTTKERRPTCAGSGPAVRRQRPALQPVEPVADSPPILVERGRLNEIGRASCRERV